jgi:hypothetical protein
MVGMAKDIADAILELYKRECLMSLLECWDHVVRWNKVWRYKVIMHGTSATIFRITAIGVIVIFNGTWIQYSMIPSIPISPPLVWVVGESLLASVLFQEHQRTLRQRIQNASLCCKFCSPVPHCEYV